MCMWRGLHVYVAGSACVCGGCACVYVGGLHLYVGDVHVCMWEVCMYTYVCMCRQCNSRCTLLASSQEPDEELQSLLSYEEVVGVVTYSLDAEGSHELIPKFPAKLTQFGDG